MKRITLMDYADMAEWLSRHHPRALSACISEGKRARHEMLSWFAVGPKIINQARLTAAYNKYRRKHGLD